MLKKLMKKEEGFTLAELLIVVAIIAVLVAISIPIFTSQLERSREATDLSNIRAAYAEASAELLTWDGKATTFDNPNIKSITKSGNDITVTTQNVEIKSQKDTPAWSSLAGELPVSNAASLADPGTAGVYEAAFKFVNGTGKPELTLTAAGSGS